MYGLVRIDDQPETVNSQYGTTPLTLDLEDQATITAALLEKQRSR
jgi:hypothetical protein